MLITIKIEQSRWRALYAEYIEKAAATSCPDVLFLIQEIP